MLLCLHRIETLQVNKSTSTIKNKSKRHCTQCMMRLLFSGGVTVN